MKTYSSSLRSKIVAFIIFITFVSFAILYTWLLTIHVGKEITIFNGILFIVMTIPSCLILYSQLKWRLILTDSSIIKQGLFQKQELLYTDIKGYSTKDALVTLEPKDDNVKAISISKSFENSDEFYNWVKAEYTDLGTTVTNIDTPDMIAKLRSAKIATYAVNVLASVVALFLILLPGFYLIIWILCILMPFIAYFIYRKYDGIVTIAGMRSSPYPSIGWSIIIAAFSMMLAGGFHYFISTPFLIYGIVSAVFLPIAFLRHDFARSTRDMVMLIFGAIYLIAGGYMYGYGLGKFINSYADHSAVQEYKAAIKEKYVTGHSKSSDNVLVLDSWGPVPIKSKITVDHNAFVTFNIDDTATIKLKDGALGVPWYALFKN